MKHLVKFLISIFMITVLFILVKVIFGHIEQWALVIAFCLGCLTQALHDIIDHCWKEK